MHPREVLSGPTVRPLSVTSCPKAKLLMNAELKLELSPHQQELILRGLRYVRSSVALEIIDWTPEIEKNRDRMYSLLDGLEDKLNGVSPAEKHAKV